MFLLCFSVAGFFFSVLVFFFSVVVVFLLWLCFFFCGCVFCCGCVVGFPPRCYCLAHGHAFHCAKDFKGNNRLPQCSDNNTPHGEVHFRGWTSLLLEETATVDGKTNAGWSTVARSPQGKCHVMFGPIITAEEHLPFAGACQQTFNTAEFLGIVGALPLALGAWAGAT